MIKYTFALSALLLGTLALTATSHAATPYPEDVAPQFMQGCMIIPEGLPLREKVTEQQQRNYCNCLYGFVQEKVPYSQYKRVDKLVRAGRPDAVDASFQSVFEQGVYKCAIENVPGLKILK